MIGADACPGGSEYVGIDAERLGPNHAACPRCGRRTAFHRITGRFARHAPRAVVPEPSAPAHSPDDAT